MGYSKAVANPPVFHTPASMTGLSSTQRVTNMSDMAAETEAIQPSGPRCTLSFAFLHFTFGGACVLRLCDKNVFIDVSLPSCGNTRQATATPTIASSVAVINATVCAWNANVDPVRAISGIVWGLGIDSLPPVLYGRHVDTNVLGPADRKGRALIVANLNIMWTDAADDGTIDVATWALVAAIEKEVPALDALDAPLAAFNGVL
ncbi:hypothetical protein F4821DRAFT_260341 [Hypoxylon rubiginosum]|uniref:Uncharacterized protein n=1 Tax=Hypoxylon rubiginosum TaxID=110542 RepID=A0ACC0D0E6_9PEZI|nr:hypothetical protein F4821DRAFT_260341 [Hypoxylon rubiginosum]